MELWPVRTSIVRRPPRKTKDGYSFEYLDPFYNDCRAYGRLKQEKRDDVAIRAHGYILLTPAQEQRVTEAHGREYVDPEMQIGLGSDKLDEDSPWHRRGCYR